MKNKNLLMFTLNNIPFILLIAVFVFFGLNAKNWFTLENFKNIFMAASYIGIATVGMTFVLLTGGIDLSVGANMFLGMTIAGQLIKLYHAPTWLALMASLAVGLAFGLFNAFCVTKVKILPFLVSLSLMISGRGTALLISSSQSLYMPPEFMRSVGSGVLFRFLPVPIFCFASIVFIGHMFLKNTTMGRQIYAVGNDREIARKSGISNAKIIAVAYTLCGLLAAISGVISIGQIGNVNPNFGEGDEFDAISAAVLGGTSLTGGVGTIFPGAVIGTLLVQMIKAGLVYMQVNLYVQPLITAMVILMAVVLDSIRSRVIAKLERRNIRAE